MRVPIPEGIGNRGGPDGRIRCLFDAPGEEAAAQDVWQHAPLGLRGELDYCRMASTLSGNARQVGRECRQADEAVVEESQPRSHVQAGLSRSARRAIDNALLFHSHHAPDARFHGWGARQNSLTATARVLSNCC